MIIKSSTVLCNDYGMVSDLAHEKAEQREETLKLRAKLEAAEAARALQRTCPHAGGIQKTDNNADRRPMPVCTFAYVSFLRLQVL